MLGERVGNYVITQKLGEGGMGEVYLAEHPQIGKRVALKVLHARLAANTEVVARFFQEAKAVNDIGHPNIVDIVDFGEVTTAAGKCVYLVMELLAGATLSKVIEGVQLDEPRALHIISQVADALATSHERGIIHRDLKPDNIMLVTRGREQDFVKLLDFGIAKVTEGAAAKTRAGMVIGTPLYMSPEQCEGRATIDHRTDIYALGIVMYEMFTGRVPFTGDGHAEILIKQISAAPAPPSTLRPGLAPHLEAVTLKALQKRPDDRFATMRELLNALGIGAHVEPQRGSSSYLANAHRPPTGPGLPVVSAPRARSEPVTGPQPPLTAPPRSHPPTEPPPVMMIQSAGARGTTPPVTMNRPASRRGLVIALLAGAVVVAVAIAIAATRGGDEPTSTAANTETAATPTPATTTTAGTPTTTTGTTPTTTGTTPTTTTTGTTTTGTPPTTTTRPTSTPTGTTTTKPAGTPIPPATATVSLSFATRPPGASIFLGDEAAARCKAPCSFTVPKADGAATIAVRLSGFVDQTRSVRLNIDHKLDVTLKKPSRPHGDAKKKPTGPTGDNLIDPSDL